MSSVLHAFSDYPVLIGVVVFLDISVSLAGLLAFQMRRARAALKPLIFFFGFVAIIAGPQIVVHSLDAFVHAREVRNEPRPTEGSLSHPTAYESGPLSADGGDCKGCTGERAGIARYGQRVIGCW